METSEVLIPFEAVHVFQVGTVDDFRAKLGRIASPVALAIPATEPVLTEEQELEALAWHRMSGLGTMRDALLVEEGSTMRDLVGRQSSPSMRQVFTQAA